MNPFRLRRILWWPSQGASKSLSEEYNHWASLYEPKFVAYNIVHSHSDPYTFAREGSYIEIEGFCWSLFLSSIPYYKSKSDGPNGIVIKELFVDRMHTEGVYYTFTRSVNPEHREVAMLQICKERSSHRKVHGFLLEECNEGVFKWIGVALLENDSLCEVIPSHPRLGASLGTWGFQWHPRERDKQVGQLKNEE